MRNLKRALSLTLASVMLLGMMVMGSSALSFNDADDISNVTAASILEELGVMQGDGKGNFMPEQTVTRAQMAIIICRIMFGNRLNVDTLATEGRFTDVAPGEYYTGFVNFAAEQGIIAATATGASAPTTP